MYIDTKKEYVDNEYNTTRRRVIPAIWTNRSGGIRESCRSRCEGTNSEANVVQEKKKNGKRQEKEGGQMDARKLISGRYVRSFGRC